MPRFEELRDAGASDPRARRVDRRRADLLGDRDPLGPRARTSPTRRAPARRAAGGCSRWPPRTASRSAPPARIRWRTTASSTSSTPSTTAASSRGCSTSPGATTRSLHSPRRRPRRRPRGRGLRPPAARAADAAGDLAPTRRTSTAATPACTPRARRSSPSVPALRRARRLRLVGRVRRLHRLPRAHATRSSSTRRSGGRCARTRLRHGRGAHLRRPDHRRRVRGAAGADRRLRRPGARDDDEGVAVRRCRAG